MSDWLTSCDAANKIEQSGGPYVERRPQINSTGTGTYEVVEKIRTVTPATEIYVGVNLATAKTAATAFAAKADVVTARYEHQGGGCYDVIVERVTYGEWEDAVPPP